MSAGLSLHIGLNRVDPGHYGDSLRLSGCRNDARDTARIATQNGFDATILLDEQAHAEAVIAALHDAARRLERGGAFVLSYAGHGAQVADRGGDEPDRKDETWLLFDRMLLDDEIYDALSRFTAGVRILLIADSCHSGSFARTREYLAKSRAALRSVRSEERPRFRTPDEPGLGNRIWREHRRRYDPIVRAVPPNGETRVRAAVIQIGSCRDDQIAADGLNNGLFTSKLKQVWASGAFGGDHHQFCQTIQSMMPETQQPTYLVLGEDTRGFEMQRPFTIESAESTQPQTKACQMNTQIERDNWSAVRTELERRLPGWKLPPTVQSLAFVTATDLTQSSATLAKQDSASLSTLDSSSLRAASGPPTVRTYWWGFELTLSSQSLRDFLNVANPVNAIAAAIGPFMGPAAPYISLIAPFVAGALEQLSGLDRGAGVCIAMSWFAPGVFVPSTVPPGRGFGDVSREPRGLGEPKDQAGLPIILAVGFNMFGVRRDEDILWNLPAGTVREKVIVNLNPPGFGNIYFAHWLSDDPTVGHFRLHVGVEPFRGGVIEMRMMIRDVYGRGVDAEASTSDQPPARTGEGLACSVISSAPINPTDGARA